MNTFISILGAIALLIWGIRMIRKALSSGFEQELKKTVLAVETKTSMAAAAGFILTLLMQSSTAMMLMISTFSPIGILSVPTIFVMLIAGDLASSLSAFFLSINMPILAPLCIMSGVLTFLYSKQRKPKNIGRGLLGLGLIFLALSLLREGSLGLQYLAPSLTSGEVILSDPGIIWLLAAGLSVVLSSSVAAILTISALLPETITDQKLIWILVLGVNAGGALLHWLLSRPLNDIIRKSVMVHSISKVTLSVLGLFSLILIDDLPMMPPDFPAVISHHLLFNFLMTPFALIAYLTQHAKTFPNRKKNSSRSITSSESLETLKTYYRRQVLHMGQIVDDMLNPEYLLDIDDFMERRNLLKNFDNRLDSLHHQVTRGCIDLMSRKPDEITLRQLTATLNCSRSMEHAGDIIIRNLVPMLEKKDRRNLDFSHEGADEIQRIHQFVRESHQMMMDIYLSDILSTSRHLFNRILELDGMINVSINSHYRRLISRNVDSLYTSSIHLDILRDLQHLHQLLLGWPSKEGNANPEYSAM